MGSCSKGHKIVQNEAEPSSVPIQKDRDSIFLMSVIETDGYGQNLNCYLYLDSINHRLSIIKQYNLEYLSYESYKIKPGVLIEYEGTLLAHKTIAPEGSKNRCEGGISLLLKNGLVDKIKYLNTDSCSRYEYDSLQHLRSIEEGDVKRMLFWKGDMLLQASIIYSAQNRFNKTINVLYNTNNRCQNRSPLIMHEVFYHNWAYLLFSHLGLFGKIPYGDNYAIENVDDMGVNSQVIYEEKYAVDGMLVECKYHNKGSERPRKLQISWNRPNISVLDKLIRGNDYK